jgi:hypothetical protein
MCGIKAIEFLKTCGYRHVGGNYDEKMTAQASEILFYKGEEYQITSEPLTDFLKNSTKSFNWTNTGCWRGYIGTWKIDNNKLFIVKLEGNSTSGSVGLDYLFPNQKEVFANWFSGELKVPQGEMIKYIHRGHFSVYEKDIIFTFSKGIITKQVIVDNQSGQIEDVSFNQILDKNIKEKINESTLIELIEMFNSALKTFPELDYEKSRKIQLEETNKLYSKVKLENWTAYEKELLFISLLKGLNIYYFVVSDTKSMPIGGFNSVMNAINGVDFVYINNKSIKWFPKRIKDKLLSQGINFEDLTPRIKYSSNSSNYDYDYYSRNWLAEAAGTSDPETMNDVYWNLD